MSGPIAPAWLVFPLAGVAMVVTAAYIIALREAPESAMPPHRARLRTATAWLTQITIPLTAYGFGVASTSSPKAFMLVWLIVVALLAFILLLAAIDLTTLAAERRRLLRAHHDAIRSARLDMVRLVSGTAVPIDGVSYSTHGYRPTRNQEQCPDPTRDPNRDGNVGGDSPTGEQPESNRDG